MDRAGVDITKCQYVFNKSSTAIGTNDVSKYSGGGFTKEKQEQLTWYPSSSGTYYLHVLTFDKAGNKKETISSEVKVEKLVKWIVKNSVVQDTSFAFAFPSDLLSFRGTPPNAILSRYGWNIEKCVYWTITSPVRFVKAYAKVAIENGSTVACASVGMFWRRTKPPSGEGQRLSDMSGGQVVFNAENTTFRGEKTMNINDSTGIRYFGIRTFGGSDAGNKWVYELCLESE